MFSKLIADLRNEAELASEANCVMLVNSHKQGWQLNNRLSGKASKDAVLHSGMGIGMGGVLGLMGVAVANQAAGTVAMYAGFTAAQTAAVGAAGLATSAGATTTLLASASTALAGLGTVAVGSAILPVATVAVLGAAIAGVAVMGISHFMKIDYDRAVAVVDAAKSNDKATLISLGRQDVGVTDWLKGAKNLVVKSLRGQYFGERALTSGALMSRPGETAKPGNAALDYELADLFGNSIEESELDKNTLVGNIGADIYDKLGVVVADEKIHACLGKARGNATSYGKILDVDLKTGLVIQSLGRGQATVHNLADFAQVPVPGQDATISYKGGKMQNAQEQGLGKAAGNHVGR